MSDQMIMSVTHVHASALRPLESELVAQLILDVPVLNILVKFCADTEMHDFQNCRKKNFRQKLSNFSA